MFKTNCTKCGGSGTIRAFSHVQAGQRFQCNGRGYFETKTDPKVLAKRHAAKAAKRRAENQANVDAGNAAHDARAAKYADDDRLGPKTRARIAAHSMFAFEAYGSLAKLDDGFCATSRSRVQATNNQPENELCQPPKS